MVQIAHRETQCKAKFIGSVWIYFGGVYFSVFTLQAYHPGQQSLICDQCLAKAMHIQVMYIHYSLHLEKRAANFTMLASFMISSK